MQNTDWSNVDLNKESDLNILDSYSFEALLTELYSNLPIEKITKEEVRKHFYSELELKIKTAKIVFEDNLNNIIKKTIDDITE